MEELNEEKAPQEEVKSMWQLTKESWYDKVNLTVKQLDIIIWLASIALVIVFIIIGLDAYGVF